jgi:GABA(A) receptor-associated protein
MDDKFINIIPIDNRKNIAKKILANYPDRVPIIIEPYSNKEPPISKCKYLAPRNLMFCHIMMEARKYIDNLKPVDNITFYAENFNSNRRLTFTDKILSKRNNITLIPLTQNIETIYHLYKNEDGFLYIIYAIENTFG